MRQAIKATLEGESVEAPAIFWRLADLDLALEMGITILMEDLTTEEFNALKVLKEERAKFRHLKENVRDAGMQELRTYRDAKPKRTF